MFVAQPGCLLLSADYSQLELRLLAHFSGDQLLLQVLSQSGANGDVFNLIAAAWQQPGQRPGAEGVLGSHAALSYILKLPAAAATCLVS